MNNASNTGRDIIKVGKRKSKKILEVLRNKRLLVALLILIAVAIVVIIIGAVSKRGKKVMTVADTAFYTEDYMIYLKLAKDDYFGKEIDEIPEATLNTIVSQETNLTVEEYLKQKTAENLKIAGIIQKIAKDNNITLSEENYKEISSEKESLITKLGGQDKFKEWLKNNRTTEEAYDKMSQTEKLYTLIYDNLYVAEKKNDLTEDEKETVKTSYKSEYKKIKQIILLTVNPQNLTKLTDKEKQQKKLLADAIYAELKKQANYSNFDEFIKKYSDDQVEGEEISATYFKDGQLLKEIEKATEKLNVGQISEVVESEYAYHIILRENLDDGYLEKLYEEAREKKLLTDISETIENTAIIIENALEKLKIN